MKSVASRIFAKFSFSFGMLQPPKQLPAKPEKPHMPRTVALNNMRSILHGVKEAVAPDRDMVGESQAHDKAPDKEK